VRDPAPEVVVVAPVSSPSDAGPANAPAMDAGPPPSAAVAFPSASARCTIRGAESVVAWNDARWRECEVATCREEPGLAAKLHVTVAPKTFVAGVTDVARVTVENTTDVPVRVPLKWSSSNGRNHPDHTKFSKPDGGSFDTSDDTGCIEAATCAVLVLEPHASFSWNAIAVPMKRHFKDCTAKPTSPLPAGTYVLEIETDIDSDRRLVAKTTVEVSAPLKRRP
jgi:hypothetical protein